MPLFGSSNSCTKHHGAPASLAEAARDPGGAPSCLAVTSTRQAAKRVPTTVGKHGSRLHLQLCRVRARHPRVRRQLVCTRDREGSGVQEVAWRMVGGDVEGNPAAIAEVSHALESWCRSRSTLGLANCSWLHGLLNEKHRQKWSIIFEKQPVTPQRSARIEGTSLHVESTISGIAAA